MTPKDDTTRSSSSIRVHGITVTSIIYDELVEVEEKQDLSGLSLEKIDKDAVVRMDELIFKLRRDVTHTVKLLDGTYRKMTVTAGEINESKIHSLYEGSKHKIIVVFEAANGRPYAVRKDGGIAKYIEVPLSQVEKFVVNHGDLIKAISLSILADNDLELDELEELVKLSTQADETPLFGRFS